MNIEESLGMKNIIFVLLMLSTVAHAADDVFEKMNKQARLLDQKLTILVDRTGACAKYAERTKIDLEGMLFVVRAARETMECQYELKDSCDKAKPLELAHLQLKDLVHKKLSQNSDVYNITKNAFAAQKCTKEIHSLNSVAAHAKQMLVEFDKLNAKKPPAPLLPKPEED